jgi:hypothetical protein
MARRQPIYYKRGNLWPPIEDIISDRNGPVNLSLALSLRFLMRRDTPDGDLVVTGTATAGSSLAAAADGGVTYQPVAGDTDEIGTFIGEWEIVFTGPLPATAPNGPGEYITIIISEDLA